MYSLLAEYGPMLAQYSTGDKPPWFVPIIGFFILWVIAVRIFGTLGFIAWLVAVCIYFSGCMGY